MREHTDITIIQHMPLEIEYPERGRKHEFGEDAILNESTIRNRVPREGTKTNS